MWCIWWTVLLYMYSAAGFVPLTEAQGNTIVELCHQNGSWSAIKCADDSGLVISDISTATFMRTHPECDFKGHIEAESDISKCSPKSFAEQQLTLQALRKACLGRPHCANATKRQYVNTNVNCSVNGSIHTYWNAFRITFTCDHNESANTTNVVGTSSSTTTAVPPVTGAPSTQGTSRPATDQTLTARASTTAEPGTKGIQALITGAAVAGVLLLCVGIAVFIYWYRKKSRRKRNESLNEPGNPHERAGPTVDSGLLAGMGNAVYAEIPKHEDPRQYEIGNVYADPTDPSFTANLLHSAGENRLVKTQNSGQPTDVYSEVQKNRPPKPNDDGKPSDVYSEVQKNRPPKPSSDVPTAGHRNKDSHAESEGGAKPNLVISIVPKNATNADQPGADEGNDYELTLVENQIYL